MLATIHSPTILGINRGILYELSVRVWPHVPARLRQLVEDVQALLLSEPSPD